MAFLSPDKNTACYNMDYDVQAIVKFLPAKVRQRLAMLNESLYRNYRLRFVPSKYFKVWHDERLILTVYDMRQFYNCSLKVAAGRLGVGTKDPLPASWYKQMKVKLNDPKTRPRLLRYALDDAALLQKIIDLTAQRFEAVGLAFERPFSNASFAERWFRYKFRYRKFESVERFARKAFHGGRIECLQVGYWRKAWHYDINSAYPSVIANLVKPDGTWLWNQPIRDDAVYAFVDCTFKIPDTEHVGPVPFRRQSGLICYPIGRFRKVVTLTEYRYLQERGWVETIHSNVQHVWPKWVYPFEEIREIYLRRKKYPQTDYALKIIQNATYGKTAQVMTSRVRHHIVDGNSEIFDGRVWTKKETVRPHTSFVYASEITARTRIRLLTDIDPRYVISYSTDGVITNRPMKLEAGKGLGQWGGDVLKELIMVGPGVYTCLINGTRVTKFRGFNSSLPLQDLLRKAGRRHIVSIKVLRNTSLKQSIRKPSELNVLRESVRFLNVNFDTKRYWDEKWNSRSLTERNYQSEAWTVYPTVEVDRYIE